MPLPINIKKYGIKCNKNIYQKCRNKRRHQEMSETELTCGYRRSSTNTSGFSNNSGGVGNRKPSVPTISTNNLDISLSVHHGSAGSARDSLSPNYERRKLSLRSNKSRQRVSSNRSSRTSGDSPTHSERSSSSKSSASRNHKNSVPDCNFRIHHRPSTLKSSFLRKKNVEYEGKIRYKIFN